ncbi:MAG: hypothetical protein HYS18_00025 [Burkholderiales bacterium]|nr:hypothetical protein [Burkholderiales bacterium]
MKMSRPTRFIAALIVLVSMLFSQLALASYICPSLMADSHPAVQSQAHDGMSGCAGMDKQQPNLCHAHDQAGNQSLDKPDLPLVQPFFAATLVLSLSPIDIALTGAYPSSELPLVQAAAPPHSILHCCFRI